METDGKLTTKKTERLAKSSSRDALLVRWLERCAETFPMYGKTLKQLPEKFDVFRMALADLATERIDFGFQEAVKNLTEFPTPAQIRQFAEAMPVPAEVRERIEGNYQSMVEAYKRKHREEMAGRSVSVLEMPDDPRAALDAAIERAAAVKAMDAPGKTLHEQHRAAALAHLGGSTMPMPREDGTPAGLLIEPERLEANREWGHGMAVKNGWIQEREPGCDE